MRLLLELIQLRLLALAQHGTNFSIGLIARGRYAPETLFARQAAIMRTPGD
jgi:hypothetical protein